MNKYCAIDLPDEAASIALGSQIAALLRIGDTVALSGELGSGKTSIARAIIAALGFTAEVPSPSFAIVQPYDPPEISIPVLHADFYRIESRAELAELGLDDIATTGVLIAEWPERIGGLADENCLAVALDFTAKGGRSAVVEFTESWRNRWPE